MTAAPKLSPWFPAGIKPARAGVYIATVMAGETYFRRWDGNRWLIGGDTIEEAVLATPIPLPALTQSRMQWRGLARKPRSS